jgi:hypothetical protein
MRTLLGAVLLFAPAFAAAQDVNAKLATRYDLRADTDNYPQATPKAALQSAVKAAEKGRYDYLVAHILDPMFVDDRIAGTKTSFAQLVADVKTKLGEDSEALKELRRFAREGEFKDEEATSSVSLKDVKDRKVFFRKVGDRWFVENRQQDEKK